MHNETLNNNQPEYEFSKPENKAEYDKQLNSIDENVQKALFSSFANMMRIIDDDEKYKKITDIINEDIYEGKYKDAHYEHGVVYHIGPVNRHGKKVSDWDELGTPEYRKPENQEKYDEQMKKIDPKVFKEINKIVHILGDTLGPDSVEYADACNKINQDIYEGRYENAKYEPIADEGGEFERGVILFSKENS